MPKYFRFSESEKLGATGKIKENQKPNAQLLHETTAISLQRYTCQTGYTRNVYILAVQNTLKETQVFLKQSSLKVKSTAIKRHFKSS
jgi:hypothetical protein